MHGPFTLEMCIILTNLACFEQFFWQQLIQLAQFFAPIFKTVLKQMSKCSSNNIFITQAFTLPSRIYGLFHMVSVVLWRMSSVIDVKYYQYFSEVRLNH